MTLVTAPAGYGKTTLVATWLDARGFKSAWLSLDEGDSDLPTFLSYLIAAVRSAFPDMRQSAESALSAPIPPRPEVLASLFVRDLDTLADSLYLVLDDFHTVASPVVRAFMERLIQHLPERLHLLLIARSDPFMSLGRLKGQRRIVELRSSDLRFTIDEAAELMRQVVGSEPSPMLPGLLTERTEGWAVGLQLAAISLRESVDPEAFIQHFAHNNDRVLTEYLTGEVLHRLPEAQRTQLLRTSILDRFCAPLCDLIAGDAMALRGADFIDDLWRTNLFIVALDGEGVWYRYHHLFRDLLRNQLKRNFTPEVIAEMHCAVSQWFEAAGLTEEAITHALAGGDGLRAARLVEANGLLALDVEDWRRLERWLAMLPPSVSQRPAILTAQAYLNHFRHKIPAMFVLLDAAENGLQTGAGDYTATQQQTILGAINALRCTGFAPGGPERILAASSMALEQLDANMVFARSLAELWQIYGLQQSGQTGAATELAYRWLGQQTEQPNVRTLRLLLALCGVYHDEADLTMASATGTTYQQVATQLQRSLSLGWARFILGWAHYYRNELEAAATCFEQVTDTPYEVHGKAALDAFTGLALTRFAQGRFDAAQTAVRALREFMLDQGTVNLILIADSLALRIEDGVESSEALYTFTGDLAGQMAGDLWELPGLTSVRVILRSGASDKLSAAAETLRTCRALAESRHRTRRCIEIAVLEARVHAAQGDDSAALEALRRGVLMSASGGAIRFFLDDGKGLRPYLERLLDQGVAPSFIRSLLAAFVAEASGRREITALPLSGDQRRMRAEDPAILLTNREMDVLLLLERRLTNKEIAALLIISPRTVQKHTVNIYEKLHAGNRREAIARARSLGLLPKIS